MTKPIPSLDSPGVARMRKFVPLGAVLIACVVVTACGDDAEQLPSQTARQMLIDLRDVREEFDAGNCTQAAEAAVAFAGQIEGLDNNVSGQLRNALSEGAGNLNRLIAESPVCLEEPAVEPPVETTTTEPTTTEPTTTTTDPTTTTGTTTTDTTTTTDPTTTTETTTTDTTTTAPPPEDDGTGGTGE